MHAYTDALERTVAMQDARNFYINGQWVEGGAGTLAIDNPNTGEALSLQASADASDVDRAVQAASAVRENRSLADLRPIERARMILPTSARTRTAWPRC